MRHGRSIWKDATVSFNPRICKRCDFHKRKPQPFRPVSIHASVKDATLHNNYDYSKIIRFNPRICKRCDSMFVKSFIDDTFKL